MNKKFIEFLARNNALLFGDFTSKSGRKTPYFVNTGAICSGKSLNTLGGFFAEKILETGTAPIIYGPAYKGIPLAIAVSISLACEQDTPNSWLFNRKEAKIYGDQGAFVGKLPQPQEEVIMVDDVFTTGGTKYDSVELLESTGAKVKALVIGVDREEKGESKNAVEEFISKTGIPVYPLAKTTDIFNYLHGKEVDGKIHITDEIYSLYQKYRDEYGS